MADNKKIAILVEHHFDEEEYRYLIKKLPEMGYQADFMSHLWGLDELVYHGMDFNEEVVAGTEIDDADVNTYAAVLLIGGYPADRLRYQNIFTEKNQSHPVVFLRKAFEAGVPVGVLDFGIWALTAAPDLLNGKEVTTNHEAAADAINAGAKLILGDDKKTVPLHQDGNLLTCKGPEFLDDFITALDGMIK